MSGGEQSLLNIARALMTNPELVLMDEPSEGLSPLMINMVGKIVGQLKEQGLSILLVEQNLPWRSSSPITSISWGRELWLRVGQ